MIGEGFRLTLVNEPTINAIVGNRVYARKIPGKGAKLPCIIYERVDEDSDNLQTLDNVWGLAFVGYDVRCVAETDAEVKRLSYAVYRFIRDYAGQMGDHECKAVIAEEPVDDPWEPAIDGTETGRFVDLIHLQLQYE